MDKLIVPELRINPVRTQGCFKTEDGFSELFMQGITSEALFLEGKKFSPLLSCSHTKMRD